MMRLVLNEMLGEWLNNCKSETRLMETNLNLSFILSNRSVAEDHTGVRFKHNKSVYIKMGGLWSPEEIVFDMLQSGVEIIRQFAKVSSERYSPKSAAVSGSGER